MDDFMTGLFQFFTGSLNLVLLLMAASSLIWIALTTSENSKLREENEMLKGEGKPKIVPTLYVKYAKADYRVKLVGNTVWVERQQPSAVNMPLPEEKVAASHLLAGHYWHHHNISSAISLYEALEENSQQERSS